VLVVTDVPSGELPRGGLIELLEANNATASAQQTNGPKIITQCA
jgi:hypothetical protein